MSYLHYLCLFEWCVLVMFFFVLLLYVSLDCPFLIAPLVFSNVIQVYKKNNGGLLVRTLAKIRYTTLA
jgi:hypothetical protein